MSTIRKRGGYQWQAQVRRKGYPPQSRTFETRKDAEAWARSVEREMDTGTFVSRADAERTTIKEIAERYEKEILPRMKSQRQEQQRINAVVERFGEYHLSAVTPAMVAGWRDTLSKRLAGQTVHHYMAVLGRLYTSAARDFGIALPLGNPVVSVRRPKIDNARSRRLEKGEEKKLSAALDESRSAHLKPAVLLALETAMRRGELLVLRWEDIDLRQRVAHLSDTKNGTSRDVPLSTAAVAVLKKLPRQISGRVFPITPTVITEGFERACERAEIEDLRFHDLRHEATSRLAEKLAMHELMKVTGHKDPRMLARYYHPRAADLAKKLG
ncbi:MAG: site-specific integrase [Burkholderiales bacterium]|nr:site-specific integrase [Burkholderiales bacterium]